MAARILTLLASADLRSLTELVGPAIDLFPCASTREVAAAIRADSPTLVVGDVRDRLGKELSAAVLSGPEIATFVTVLRATLKRDDVDEILKLIRSGAPVEVALVGFDDLVAVVQRAVDRKGAVAEIRTAMLARCAFLAGSSTAALIVATVILALARPTMQELARATGRSVRSLERTAHIAGLPTPRELLARSCCVQIGWLLQVAGWSPRAISRVANFDSLPAFHHFVRRHAGVTPKRMAAAKDFAVMMEDWVALLL